MAVHGDLVYVLNALNGGSVQGYRACLVGRRTDPRLERRALGLDPSATPEFVNTPGQVAFSPDGRQLIVTTKANGNDIDVFGVGFGGRLSTAPAVNAEPGTVPFAISFDQFGHVVIAEAGTNALATFSPAAANGTVTPARRGRHRPVGDLLGGPAPAATSSRPTRATPNISGYSKQARPHADGISV